MSYESMEAMRAKMPALCRAVARELGEGWRARPIHAVVALDGPDGEALSVSPDWDGKRIEIKGGYPAGVSTGDLTKASINVTAARGATVIAREIRRRLMPAYSESLVVALKRKRANEEKDAKQARTFTKVREVLGVPSSTRGYGRDGTTLSRYRANYGSIEVKVTGGSTIEIQVSGELDEMMPILRQIATLPGGAW